MSVGFNRSYQYAGINRVGKYREAAREKGPSTDGRGDAETGGRGEKANEVWRRVTGIFTHVSVSNEERLAGLRRLAAWIEGRVGSRKDAKAQRTDFDSLGLGFAVDVEARGDDGATPHPAFASLTSALSPLSRGEGELTGVPPVPHKLSLVDEWDFAPGSWARVRMGGASVEGICVQLGLTHIQLSALLREFCGMSAGEFLDGLRLKGLKGVLVEKMRMAAFELWGFPGAYVAVKLERQSSQGPTLRHEDAKTRRKKESKYFRKRPEDFFYESRFEERERRVAEICEILNSPRSRTASQQQAGHGTHRGTIFEVESLAMSAGFSSAARLKRACLNVFGKTLRAIECELAEEVVQFYLCAEDRELREIASRENETQIIFRARELYHKSVDRPTEPFLDEWSKFEMLKPEWLSRMRAAFGVGASNFNHEDTKAQRHEDF